MIWESIVPAGPILYVSQSHFAFYLYLPRVINRLFCDGQSMQTCFVNFLRRQPPLIFMHFVISVDCNVVVAKAHDIF